MQIKQDKQANKNMITKISTQAGHKTGQFSEGCSIFDLGGGSE